MQRDIRLLPRALDAAVKSLFADKGAVGASSSIFDPNSARPCTLLCDVLTTLHAWTKPWQYTAAICIADLVAGLHETIGEPLLTAYTAVKQHEAEYFKPATLATERQMLWNRY
jgi:hypothetical protein